MRGAVISRRASTDQPWDWIPLDNDIPVEYVRYLPVPEYVAPASEEVKQYLRKTAKQRPGPYSQAPRRSTSNGERERLKLAAEDPMRATFVDNVNEWARGQRWYVYLVLAHHLAITQENIHDKSLPECSWTMGKYLDAIMKAERNRQVKVRELQQRYGGSRNPAEVAYINESRRCGHPGAVLHGALSASPSSSGAHLLFSTGRYGPHPDGQEGHTEGSTRRVGDS